MSKPDWALRISSWTPLAAVLGVGVWLAYVAPNGDKGAKPAVVAAEVRKVPQVNITPPQVRVYAPQAKLNLAKSGGIPVAVAESPTTSVLASSRVPASERPTTVTTVIDSVTGVSETFVAAAALPWFALENRGAVSIDYGYKRAKRGYVPVQAARITVRQDILQFKGLHLGVTASAYSDGDYFVGAGLSYRW
mgnify:CR=1 FL=1